jgi:hypothetical protein
MGRARLLLIPGMLASCFAAASAVAQPVGPACEYGFRPWGPRCMAVHVPRDADLDEAGHGWVCHQGFHRIGEGCLPNAERARASAAPVRMPEPPLRRVEPANRLSSVAPPIPAAKPCATWLDEPGAECVAPGRAEPVDRSPIRPPPSAAKPAPAAAPPTRPLWTGLGDGIAGSSSPPVAETATIAPAGIRHVQSQLAMLGYLDGPVDGRLDDRTEHSIKRFQQAVGAPADGRITTDLYERLQSEYNYCVVARSLAADPAPVERACAGRGE